MELEFERAVKALDDHIEDLTQDLLFSIAEERRHERITQIISIKRESDKAVEERMKLVRFILDRSLFQPHIVTIRGIREMDTYEARIKIVEVGIQEEEDATAPPSGGSKSLEE
ncbi:MAG: hypothetical protein ACJ71D_09890 [Nitrososphaera sp.]